jgi:hypothetical protein
MARLNTARPNMARPNTWPPQVKKIYLPVPDEFPPLPVAPVIFQKV